MSETVLLAILIFAAAVLYSAAGQAGASGYLAAMAFVGLAADVMKPAALVLNIVVATIATAQFYKAGCFSWRTLWPFVVGSIPLSFVGGAMHLPSSIYKPVVGVVLLLAAFRLVVTASRKVTAPAAHASLPAAVVAGAAIGLLSGLTGTGGGIFLSPLLLFMGWAETRETAGVSAAFVLVNSIAGLAGNLASVQHLPPEISYWAVAAAMGGLIGTEFGSRHLAPDAIRYMLAVLLIVAGCKMMLT